MYTTVTMMSHCGHYCGSWWHIYHNHNSTCSWFRVPHMGSYTWTVFVDFSHYNTHNVSVKSIDIILWVLIIISSLQSLQVSSLKELEYSLKDHSVTLTVNYSDTLHDREIRCLHNTLMLLVIWALTGSFKHNRELLAQRHYASTVDKSFTWDHVRATFEPKPRVYRQTKMA